MKYSAKQLCEQFTELVIDSRNTDREFSRIDGANDFGEQSLVFISEASQIQDGFGVLPAVVVTNKAIADAIDDESVCVIVVANVRLAQALIKQQFAEYNHLDPEWDSVHDSAVVHPSAKLGHGVRIGPNAVVGKNVEIGDNSVIRANSVIEHDVQIGSDCVINSLVNVGYGCVIGNRVIIRPGVIIGSEGFGFAQDELRQYHRIPHTGIVELQDDVQIGSNCNIDRGTYGKTLICRGVKIDSLCQIAHNVTIDQDALIVSQSGVAGSSKVGKRVVISGQAAVSDHVKVADDAVLLHRCGVTQDIESSGMWAGLPAKPFKEYVRNLSLSKRLDRLNKKFDELKKSLK